MFFIETSQVKVSISSKGAELQSLFHKGFNIEYLWQGDPAYWAKRSPVLFPIVGSLKNNTYYYGGREYKLPRHGFSRDMEFRMKHQTKNQIVFVLESNATTLESFPFQFQFSIKYEVAEDVLKASYHVLNMDQQEIFFSLGAHPAFNLPLIENTSYEDYELVFSETENTERWPIDKDGLIEDYSVPFLNNTNKLSLSKELFLNDAVVFKNLKSDLVTLRSESTNHGVEFRFPSFPFLGLWASPEADFICIEPWCGIADSTNSTQNLMEKEGINCLPPGGLFERSWEVRLI